MAAETHPSSSSSSDNYDVFLSFRGEDTRRNFTDHLYNALIQAGIRTFRDSEELHHGEEIGPKLLKSIEQSRISIPIFSKNYASSKWCLRELTKIMEFKKTCGQIVWPIFYKVEPRHVRNQTGCFEEAFLEHKNEQSEEVREWRHALKEAGNLIGWDSEAPKYSLESSDLIKSVVDKALTEVIQITTLHVAKHPIGIDSHVEKVMRMLDVESHGVLFVGIHGMGGIGKTTTAKAVFNTISSQFESRSFLADVREKASKGRGLVDLQNDLASDLLKGTNLRIGNVDHGINVIKNQFCNKKVLIVLDDVDHDEQLQALAGGCDWFGSGSRIIITTRDEHILHVDLVDKSKIYKPNELDKNLSVQLFSKHAFGRDQPPQDFMELSSRVVSIVGGLPLSLIVVGSFLRDKKEHTEWEDTLKMLKEFPQEEVQKQLKISYDGLYKVFKELFLDIACFFIGMDKESIILACDAKVGIKVLVYKSLVKIDSDNKLRMHDQLRDMGREIVRQENIKKPGKRSRLWSHKEALKVLKEYKGTRNVEGLFLDFGYQEQNHIELADLLTKAFEKMSDLRLLQVDHADHDGNKFGHLPQGLKWLSLKGISCKCVPTISRLKKLAVLDLSGSDITDDWNGWQQIQSIKTLKVLDLRRCRSLEATPHFSCDTSLERLVLNDCRNLVAVHESIDHLKKLVFLSLEWCENLTELPDSICELSSIKSLILSRCENLEKLPKELGNMESLTELIIDGTAIDELLDSIGLLEKLERLSARECIKLTELPDSICKLSSIKSLVLSGCKNLEKLPKELGNMESLTELIIDNTGIEEIPDSIGLLKKLERLSAWGCGGLVKLPHSMGTMESLTELIIDHTIIEEIPDSIGLLEKLERFSARGCWGLVKLPHSMGTMESLTELIIDRTSIEEIPDSIGLLEKLKRLSASECRRLEKLPNLSNLKSLQELNLYECLKLLEIQGIGLSLLHQLDLKNCKTLKFLPELPPGLIKLNISGCALMERLPNLSNLKSLKELRFDKCYKLAKIEGIDGLTLLQEFDFTDCRKLQSLPELPSSVIKLEIKGCTSMERLPKLSSLKSLKVLHLKNCMNLANIQGINDLTLLQELDLGFYSKLQSLSELPSSLTRIHVYDCENLLGIQGFSDLSLLQTLHLDSCRELQSLDLSNLRILKSLRLEYCGNLAEIQGLESLESLIDLQVRGCYTYVKTLPESVAEGMLPTAFNEAEIRGLESSESLIELPESLIELPVHQWYTYVETLRKSVVEEMLPTTAFNEGEIRNNYLIPEDDNIKGTIFYFVYQLMTDPALFRSMPPDIFSIEADIQRNDGKKPIRCFHNLRIEGMKSNNMKDRFYSCYFQGLTWFGFPLKKRDKIHVIRVGYNFDVVKLKMLDLVMEYEGMEDSQQLKKRVVPVITSRTKKGPREYDDQKEEYDDAGPSNWKPCIPREVELEGFKIHFKETGAGGRVRQVWSGRKTRDQG